MHHDMGEVILIDIGPDRLAAEHLDVLLIGRGRLRRRQGRRQHFIDARNLQRLQDTLPHRVDVELAGPALREVGLHGHVRVLPLQGLIGQLQQGLRLHHPLGLGEDVGVGNQHHPVHVGTQLLQLRRPVQAARL